MQGLENRWTSPSGGLLWHWRAWRRQHHWMPFRRTVARWLEVWKPATPGLILIGPSAGWTLPHDFLAQFEHLVVIDPDPLARWWFARRHRDLTLQYDNTDILSPGGIATLRERYPAHALLFCNVLGQILPDDETTSLRWLDSLRQSLTGATWASYHDWISTNTAPLQLLDRWFEADTPLDEVIACGWPVARIEVTDHLTGHLCRHMPFACTAWPLLAHRWHLVQWVAQG